MSKDCSLRTPVLLYGNYTLYFRISSVQFSHSVMSNSLRSHELQHARLPCPSPTPGAYSNLMSIESVIPSNRLILCHPLSSRLQSFPASGSFPMCQLFAWGGQSIGTSASASILPMNIQGWFPLGWTGWISLKSKGLSKNDEAGERRVNEKSCS